MNEDKVFKFLFVCVTTIFFLLHFCKIAHFRFNHTKYYIEFFENDQKFPENINFNIKNIGIKTIVANKTKYLDGKLQVIYQEYQVEQETFELINHSKNLQKMKKIREAKNLIQLFTPSVTLIGGASLRKSLAQMMQTQGQQVSYATKVKNLGKKLKKLSMSVAKNEARCDQLIMKSLKNTKIANDQSENMDELKFELELILKQLTVFVSNVPHNWTSTNEHYQYENIEQKNLQTKTDEMLMIIAELQIKTYKVVSRLVEKMNRYERIVNIFEQQQNLKS